MRWNGTPHQCTRQQIQPCACCSMPTNTRFLASGLCPACRLAMVKAELDEMTEAEATAPTLTDDDLDDLWQHVRDHLSL